VAVFRLDKTEAVTEYHVKIARLPDGYTADTAVEYGFDEGDDSVYIFIEAPAE
jgi:hypothetical protein